MGKIKISVKRVLFLEEKQTTLNGMEIINALKDDLTSLLELPVGKTHIWIVLKRDEEENEIRYAILDEVTEDAINGFFWDYEMEADDRENLHGKVILNKEDLRKNNKRD